MTNREWLRSLTDEKLAEFFSKGNVWAGICNICAYGDGFCVDHECHEGITEWLQQEHEE